MINTACLLWRFFIEPNYKTFKNISLKEQFIEFFSLGFIKFFLSIIIGISLKLLIGVENIAIPILKEEYTIIELIFIGGLSMPLIEEIIFRLPLKFSPFNLGLSVFFLSYTVISKLYFNISIFNIDTFLIARLISSFILGAIVYFISSFKMQLISKIWVNNFKYVLYFSIFSFGFLHYKNFNISSINFFFLPVIVLPQFISAIIYSYIRVNYNFWYAVAFHCLNNIIIIII